MKKFWCVYTFEAGNFELQAAYNVKDDADNFAKDLRTQVKDVWVVNQNINELKNTLLQSRLGQLEVALLKIEEIIGMQKSPEGMIHRIYGNA